MVVPYFDQTAPVGLSLPLEDGRMEKLPMKSGRPGATGFFGWASWHAFNFAQGVFSGLEATAERSIVSNDVSEEALVYKAAHFALSNGNALYGASSTVMPASADITAGLYLGRPAEV